MSSPEWGSVPLLPLCRDAIEGQGGLRVRAGICHAVKKFRGVFRLRR
jgi:hypothetical protein